MQIGLENDFIQCVIDPKNASWSVYSKTFKGAFIENATINVQYKHQRTRFRALNKWSRIQIKAPEEQTSPHGELQIQEIIIGPDKNNVEYTLTFAIPQAVPLLLWKIKIHNLGTSDIAIHDINLMNAGYFRKKGFLPKGGLTLVRAGIPEGGHGVIRFHHNPGEPAFYTNGWQSWSYSGTYRPNEHPINTRLGVFAKMLWNNPGAPKPKIPGRFTSEMFGILGDRSHRVGILAGFLSQKQHFGVLEAHVDALYPAMRLLANGDGALLKAGMEISTDWAVINFLDIDSEEPLGTYLEAVAKENNVSIKNNQPITGWCSWYHYFQNVTENDILQNIESIKEIKDDLKLNLIQIDDGFEKQIGDWLKSHNRFPHGVAPLADKIRSSGFLPGLWLAPFIVHPKSKLRHKHPDWLLRNKFRLPVNAGFIWNTFTNALDLTKPDVMEYIDNVIHTAVHNWGYKYLKLDFLYAAALPGRYHDPTKTRAQVLRSGLERVRQIAGEDTTLLACGCPLGSAIGIADAMRVSPDVAPTWHPRFEGHELLLRKEPSMPAVKNAIHNTITRAFLHKRWWDNDPDCLLLGENTHLTIHEIQSLASVIAFSGGTFTLSDDISTLPPDRLRIAKSLLPAIGKTPRVLDWFDSANPRLLRLNFENSTGAWNLFGILNWNSFELSAEFTLDDLFLNPQDEYFACSFWDGKLDTVENGKLFIEKIPPHGIKVISMRKANDKHKAQYLGGNLHISQGLEVDTWQETEKQLHFTINRPGLTKGYIYLYIPKGISHATLNQNPINPKPKGNNIYQLECSFIQKGEIIIDYQQT